MNEFRRNVALPLAILSLLVFAGIFVFLAANHVAYPGFLEPMEGDVLQHIQQVCRGEAIYQTPTAEFIPLSYMPLYYVFAAPFYAVFGDSFAGPRLLSCLCAAISGGLCCWIAWRESRLATASCVAGALFFSSYRIMNASLTVALPDSLLLVWLLSGFAFLAYGTRRWHDHSRLRLFALRSGLASRF
jgi:4-amino-4-deoxy-L-arabinose transferase-like glycosyltransferase